MKNYQKLYYQHYYQMADNGDHTEVSRRICFAPPEEPTAQNPYIQRWYYDPEAGYAIRLPRNQLGETLGKRNAADRKKNERTDVSDSKHHGLELDKPISFGDDGSEICTELEDCTADIAAICEDKARLEALIDLLNTLSEDDRELWSLIKSKAKKQEIADRFGITLDGVRYREKRLKQIIASDSALKSFYTDD